MANKIFFPPGGVKTFSDNLVGFQIVDGGGLTQGNFQFTTAIYEKANRTFDTGIFSDAYTLENLKIDDIQQAKKIVEKNFKVYPNFDLSEITSFAQYGSLAKRMSASAIKILNNFPGGIEIYNTPVSNLYSGPTAFNISYNAKNDETSMTLDCILFRNPFQIDYTTNAKRNIEVQPFPISKYRALIEYYEKYSLYFEDLKVEYPLTDFIPASSFSAKTIDIIVQGNPFSGQTFYGGPLIIKPSNELTQQIFDEELDEVEKFLLNRNTSPKYMSTFVYPDYGSGGKKTIYTEKIVWPLSGFWNLEINGQTFDKYLTDLQRISSILDEYKTNLISRFLVTGSIKEFDTPDQRVEKVLQLYGREFDEVKKFIDALAHMNSVNYQVGNDIPSQLLSNLAQTLGINPNISPITTENFIDSVFNPNPQQIYAGQAETQTPTELNYQYYRNVILNSAYMFKTKGTRKSLEYVMRFIGAPEALLEFNEVIYLADTKINTNKFDEQFASISGGTTFIQEPTLDLANTFSIQGVTYTGYTTSGLIKLTPKTLSDFGIDSNGYPKSPSATETDFFQKGAGWFEKSPQHRSPEVADTANSSFDPSNPFLVSTLKPFSFGQEYMDNFRKFPDMRVGYTLTRIADNQKSWPVDQTGSRKDNSNFNGVNYKVNDDKLVVNSKNIELYVNVGQGITYDIWDMSVKYNYPIPNSGLTSPYPYPGNVDWTFINPKPKEKTFFEFAQDFYNNFINVRNRQIIFDGKTGGYPTLQSVFWNYLQSEETVGLPSNKFTYQKMIDFTLGLGDHWQRLLEQVVPGTTLWLTGQKMENTIFHRQKFVWRRQRGCSFIPVECIPCRYNGQPFSYDCIDQTLTCQLSGNGPAILQQTLATLLKNSGYTQTQCDLNSLVTNWYIDCRLDNQILVQANFYTGYGLNDYPSQTQIINSINSELQVLYQYGLNYYLAGNELIVSNSTCYDNFTNSSFRLNIGINININCN